MRPATGGSAVARLVEHSVKAAGLPLWGAIIPNEANLDSDHSGSNIVALHAAEP